jgi:hypothetical protein
MEAAENKILLGGDFFVFLQFQKEMNYGNR